MSPPQSVTVPATPLSAALGPAAHRSATEERRLVRREKRVSTLEDITLEEFVTVCTGWRYAHLYLHLMIMTMSIYRACQQCYLGESL
jgi:hypothetical protein